MAFFKANGFLVKRGLLDGDALRRIREYVFSMAPSTVDADSPSTWVNPPFIEGLHNPLAPVSHGKDGRSGDWKERPRPPGAESFSGIMSEKGSGWKLMSPTPNAATGKVFGGDLIDKYYDDISYTQGLGSEPWLLDLTANHPNMRQVVTQMVGGPIRLCARTRGIYTIWPADGHEEKTVGGHNDGRPGQLSAMCLASDVHANCGGFHVWPGSPNRLYKYWCAARRTMISN